MLPQIPAGDFTPLIRTDFSDESAWQQVAGRARRETEQGFRAELEIVDDPAFAGADGGALAEQAAASADHGLLILADRLTMTDPGRPLLCLEVGGGGGAFRAAPEALWGVENNLRLANMDFDDFAGALDGDGIFRGFR